MRRVERRDDLSRRACAAAGSRTATRRYIDARSCDEMLPRGRAPRVLPTRSTPSARASPSRPSRSPRVFERRGARWACRSSCTPTSSRTCDGAALAARYGALSADHLEYTDEAGVAAMAAAGTVAVLLPGAFYFLRETQKPPVELFRRHGVPMAVATDCNPGTSPLTSLLLAMNMAATLFRLTVDEVPRRRHARGGARARAAGESRHARSRQVVRPRDLGHRAAGRARLSHGLQPAASRASGEAQ